MTTIEKSQSAYFKLQGSQGFTYYSTGTNLSLGKDGKARLPLKWYLIPFVFAPKKCKCFALSSRKHARILVSANEIAFSLLEESFEFREGQWILEW